MLKAGHKRLNSLCQLCIIAYWWICTKNANDNNCFHLFHHWKAGFFFFISQAHLSFINISYCICKSCQMERMKILDDRWWARNELPDRLLCFSFITIATFTHKTRHFCIVIESHWRIKICKKKMYREMYLGIVFISGGPSLTYCFPLMNAWMNAFSYYSNDKENTVRKIQHASIQSIVCTLNGNKSQIWLDYNRNNSQTYSSSIGHLLNMRALCMIRNGQK